MNWHEHNGYDWCLIETPDAGPYLNLTLGYGLVDEPLTEFGTLQLLAGMLQTELSRPVETGLGRATVPEVTVHVGSDITSISMRGDATTLQATWRRLSEALAQRHPLDRAEPVAMNISAAPRDVSSRFGMTSLTLAASPTLQVEASHDPLALLGYLNPSAGNVRAAMCTTTPELMTNDFVAPDVTPVSASVSRYRAETRSGAMEFPPGHALISVVVPRSADGETSVRILAQQAAHHLGNLTQRDLGVSVSLVPVGPDVLATIMSPEMILGSQQRSQLHDQLVSRPIPDHRIDDAVHWAHENRSVSAALDRRVHGLDGEPVSVDGTHQALGHARSTMRFFTDPASTIPTGYGPVQPELPAPEGQHFRPKGSGDTIVIGNDILEHQRGGSPTTPAQYDRVELQHLALVIEDPRGAVILIDREYRTVEVVYEHYRKAQQLREAIEQRITGVPRLTAHNAVRFVPSGPTDKQSGSWWKWAVLLPLLVVLYIVVRSALAAEPDSEEPAESQTLPEDLNVESAVGETATLPNWSRVTVHSVEPFEPEPDVSMSENTGTHYLVDIEYCAAEEDDSIDPEHFRLFHADNTMRAHTLEGVDAELPARSLETGQCATGNIGFFIADEDITDLTVDYAPGGQGSLTWTVEDQE